MQPKVNTPLPPPKSPDLVKQVVATLAKMTRAEKKAMIDEILKEKGIKIKTTIL